MNQQSEEPPDNHHYNTFLGKLVPPQSYLSHNGVALQSLGEDRLGLGPHLTVVGGEQKEQKVEHSLLIINTVTTTIISIIVIPDHNVPGAWL